MVAGDDDDSHFGTCIVDVEHPFYIKVDGGIGWGCNIENVAAHQQGIRLVGVYNLGQLPQEVTMLLATVIAIKILAKMPVTGVDKFKHK